MKPIFATTSLALILAACSPEATDKTEVAATPPAAVEKTAQAGSLLMPLLTETTTAITGSDLGERIAVLADDTFEGRGPGSEAGEAAATWIAAEMERVGLKPAVDGSWYQTVEMVNQSLDESQSQLTISSDPEAPAFEFKNQTVFWTKHQNEAEVSFSESPVVFVGYGAVAPEYDWNDYEGLDVKGKTVVILVNDPGFATKDPELFNGNAMTYYGRWTYKYEEAARQGATAAIIIHETEPAAYGWDVIRNSWTGAQADLVRNNGGSDRALLEGWVTRDVATALFEEAGLDYEALKSAATKPGFKAVPYGRS